MKFYQLILMMTLSQLSYGLEPIRIGSYQDVKNLNISKLVYILDNTNNQRTFDEVSASSSLDELFKKSESNVIRMGLDTSSIWIKFSIVNRSQQSLQYILETRYSFLDKMRLYEAGDSDGSQPKLAGDTVKLSDRQYSYRFPVLRLTAKPGQNIYFLKVETQGSMYLPLFLWNENGFKEYTARDYGLLGTLLGFCFCMIGYNFFLAISFRSKAYAFYVAYIISFTLYNVASQGLAPEYLGNDFGFWLAGKGSMVAVYSSLLLSLLFSYHFLNIKVSMRKLKIYYVVVGGTIFTLFLSLFILSYNISLKLTNLSIFSVSFFLILVGYLAAKKGYRPAYFYLISWGIIFVGNSTAVLKIMGVLPLNFITHWGVLLSGSLEMVLLSLALGDRVKFMQVKNENRIKELNTELKDHLQIVEETVKERTKRIQSILNNVKSGFAIVNRRFKIEKDFTDSCFKLLGPNLASGQELSQWLQLDTKQSNRLNIMLDQVFMDQLPEEVTLRQIKSTYSLNHKYIQIEGGVIRGESGNPESILVTFTDVSELTLRSREAKKHNMLFKIIENKYSFGSLLGFTKEKIQALSNEFNENEVKGFLHTLKGNCLVFNMEDVASQIHVIEDRERLTREDIQEIESIFKTFLQSHYSILGLSWEDLEDEEFEANTIKDLIGPLNDDIRILANKLGKNVKFTVLGAETEIPDESYDHVIQHLIHLIRNAVIHGIESERKSVHKPITGNILLSFETNNNKLIIKVKDDGRGINLKALRQKLVEAELVSLEEAIELTEYEVFSKLSLIRNVDANLFSGRGVGVSSVIQLVQAKGGEVQVNSEEGIGTEFIIKLPLQSAGKVAV